jgi:hypothetical protein
MSLSFCLDGKVLPLSMNSSIFFTYRCLDGTEMGTFTSSPLCENPDCAEKVRRIYTDKKENKIFLIFKKIQRDWVQSHI